ncbi:MAG: hypothetical protein M1821_009927 [Bathelium mastoideum]|nr:MAG: hypothetical protein M1821_009927 [Bathelium mastoideum]KAI9690301.1 MAG: hypothetical protein M1822_009262 [Bathelium mastoideum]
MRLHQAQLGFLHILLLPDLVSSVTLDCTHVRAGKQSFNFESLKGPHSVHHVVETPPTIKNTTYTIDLCAGLKLLKDTPNKDQCPDNARVCGIQYSRNTDTNTTTIDEVIPLAGEFGNKYPLHLDPTNTRLKGSDSHADAGQEGVRIELNGGRYPFDSSKGTKQKVFIEMLCDMDRSGLENVPGDGRVPVDELNGRLAPRGYSEDDEENDDNEGDDDPEKGDDDGNDGDGDGEDNDASLQFINYQKENNGKDEVGVLRLKWRTKWACEGMADKGGDDSDDAGDDKSQHWGFFTWFIIILFLAVAAYLIFGSWLNYNRYGARGWDLLPHGDTIRDIPYIVKDWGRRAVNAVQGPGSRGGYSAV